MFEELAQWQQERMGKITASEIWKIMVRGKAKDAYFGDMALKYIKQKVSEILTCEPNNGGRNNFNAMEWGNSHENEAIWKVMQYTKEQIEYFGVGNPRFFEYTPFSGGSPDGLSEYAVWEIKCPFNSAEHYEHFLFTDMQDVKSYKPEYYWQVNANMLFTNREQGFLCSYDPRYAKEEHQLKIVEFKLLPEVKEQLIERISEAEKQMRLSIDLMDESVEMMLNFRK